MAIVTSWQVVLAFYLGVAAFIYYHKDKFDFQGKIVALYRADVGIDAMQRIADKYGAWIRKLGYVGIYAGYAGMAVIVGFLVKGVWDLFYQPQAPPVIAPVLPGVDVPGSPVTIPLISGLLSLFVVIVIHEFSHGIVSKSHDVPIESSGFLLFGPIPGAFVEPDEDKLENESGSIQNAVFAAGPFSNVITGGVAIALIAFALSPAVSAYFVEDGVTFPVVKNGTPADRAGLQEDTVYTLVDGSEVRDVQAFIDAVEDVEPNETVTIGNADTSHTVRAGTHPDDASKGYLGVNITTHFANDDTVVGSVLLWIREFFNLFVMLSFGLGLANLLPLGPVDGGRMYHIAATYFFGEETGEWVWSKTSVVVLAVIVLLLLDSVVFQGILGW